MRACRPARPTPTLARTSYGLCRLDFCSQRAQYLGSSCFVLLTCLQACWLKPTLSFLVKRISLGSSSHLRYYSFQSVVTPSFFFLKRHIHDEGDKSEYKLLLISISYLYETFGHMGHIS